MLKSEARTILMGLSAESLDYDSLTPTGRREMREAIECILSLPTGLDSLRVYLDKLERKHESVCAELHSTQAKLAAAQELIAEMEARLVQFDNMLIAALKAHNEHLAKLDSILA